MSPTDDSRSGFGRGFAAGLAFSASAGRGQQPQGFPALGSPSVSFSTNAPPAVFAEHSEDTPPRFDVRRSPPRPRRLTPMSPSKSSTTGSLSSQAEARPQGFRIIHPSTPAFSMKARRRAVPSETGPQTFNPDTPGPAAVDRSGFESGIRGTHRSDPAFSMGRRFDQLGAVADPRCGFRSSWSSLKAHSPGPGERQEIGLQQTTPAYSMNPRRQAVPSETGPQNFNPHTPGPASVDRSGFETGIKLSRKNSPAFTMGRRIDSLGAVADPRSRSSWSSLKESTPGPGAYLSMDY